MISFFKKLSILSVIIFLITGCSSHNSSKTFEQQMWEQYKKNNRLDKFNEIQKKFDGNKIILWLNSDKDQWSILNYLIYGLSFILPDPPTILATGGVLAFIYGLAWLLGITLTGGGILKLLAFIGKKIGPIFVIPPVIAGIIFIGVLFEILIKLFSILF
jgi:hypothetical protein